MKDVLVRSVFGLLFLMVVFTPFVYDIYNNANLMNLVFYLFALLGTHELFNMSSHTTKTSNLKMPALLLVTALFLPLLMQTAALFFPYLSNPFFHFLSSIKVLIGLWIVLALFIVYAMFITFKQDNISYLLQKPFVFACFYPILPLWLLSLAYTLSSGLDKTTLLVVLIPIYLNDTLAYVFGRLFGKTKMAPSISPKKSWEGFAGGVIGTLIVMNVLFTIVFGFNLSFTIEFSLICIGISVLATLGDLFESKLKRSIDIKDSGALLPGHGGILDRIDAMLFVAPLIYIPLTFF